MPCRLTAKISGSEILIFPVNEIGDSIEITTIIFHDGQKYSAINFSEPNDENDFVETGMSHIQIVEALKETKYIKLEKVASINTDYAFNRDWRNASGTLTNITILSDYGNSIRITREGSLYPISFRLVLNSAPEL